MQQMKSRVLSSSISHMRFAIQSVPGPFASAKQGHPPLTRSSRSVIIQISGGKEITKYRHAKEEGGGD